MEIEVISRKDNTLLGRIELQFKISHPRENTPRREDVRNEIAAFVNSKKDRVVIDNMHAVFGKSETTGYAKVYNSKELAREIEPEYVLKRNNLFEEPKKKSEGKKTEEKPEGSGEKSE